MSILYVSKYKIFVYREYMFIWCRTDEEMASLWWPISRLCDPSQIHWIFCAKKHVFYVSSYNFNAIMMVWHTKTCQIVLHWSRRPGNDVLGNIIVTSKMVFPCVDRFDEKISITWLLWVLWHNLHCFQQTYMKQKKFKLILTFDVKFECFECKLWEAVFV